MEDVNIRRYLMAVSYIQLRQVFQTPYEAFLWLC